MDSEELGEGRWLRLRCGECGYKREVTVTNEAAQTLERQLKPGLARIAAALRRLERESMIEKRESMIEEVTALIAGLERDLIDADDFAR